MFALTPPELGSRSDEVVGAGVGDKAEHGSNEHEDGELDLVEESNEAGDENSVTGEQPQSGESASELMIGEEDDDEPMLNNSDDIDRDAPGESNNDDPASDDDFDNVFVTERDVSETDDAVMEVEDEPPVSEGDDGADDQAAVIDEVGGAAAFAAAGTLEENANLVS